MAEQVRVEDFKAAQDVMRSVLLVALVCGALVTGILQVCSRIHALWANLPGV
jgi:hypothetical protein